MSINRVPRLIEGLQFFQEKVLKFVHNYFALVYFTPCNKFSLIFHFHLSLFQIRLKQVTLDTQEKEMTRKIENDF